jgi:uncharacterized protein (DUF362 family)
MKLDVVIKILKESHQKESFTKFKPLNSTLIKEIRMAVKGIFDALGGTDLLKSSGEVYIKPNAVDAKPYSFTRIEVLREIIEYWKKRGAKKIFLFENSTQANYTRLVYHGTGYMKLCRQTGTIPVFLDEDKSERLDFKGKEKQTDNNPEGYELSSFEMPATVMRLIRERDKHLYINVPKLKTHSMGVVTLGVKNQWAFPMHKFRGLDHNYNLPYKLVDILGYVAPDVTLIEGVEGSIHGHYFATALADKQVRPFKILIGSKNVVAADITGSKIFGYDVKDVPHLKIAVEKGLGNGVKSLNDINLKGDITDLSDIDLIGDMPDGGSYPWDLYPCFPEDVDIIKGSEMACREGCVNNPLCAIQTMCLDHGGKGGWTLLMGKGHDQKKINAIKGKVLVVGNCAIGEVSQSLINRLGKKNVYLSSECNNLCDTANALCNLMKVGLIDYVPVNPVTSLFAVITAKIKGSTSRVPNPLAHIIKVV